MNFSVSYTEGREFKSVLFKVEYPEMLMNSISLFTLLFQGLEVPKYQWNPQKPSYHEEAPCR